MKYNDKIPRPDVMRTVSQRIDTGWGQMYVNITIDADGDPFEVFIEKGNSGGYTKNVLEAWGKTISTALRSGTRPELIAKCLLDVKGEKKAVDCGDRIESIPDGIGIAITRYITGNVGQSIRTDDGELRSELTTEDGTIRRVYDENN